MINTYLVFIDGFKWSLLLHIGGKCSSFFLNKTLFPAPDMNKIFKGLISLWQGILACLETSDKNMHNISFFFSFFYFAICRTDKLETNFYSKKKTLAEIKSTLLMELKYWNDSLCIQYIFLFSKLRSMQCILHILQYLSSLNIFYYHRFQGQMITGQKF